MRLVKRIWFLLQSLICDSVFNELILAVALHVPPLDCSHVSTSYCDFWKSTYSQLYNKIKIFSTDTNYSESAYQISKGYESILVPYIPWCSCSVTLPLNVWYRSWSQTYGKKNFVFKEIKWEKDQKKKKRRERETDLVKEMWTEKCILYL